MREVTGQGQLQRPAGTEAEKQLGSIFSSPAACFSVTVDAQD